MENNSLLITWLGHSCFKVVSGGYSVILDPYEENYVPGLKEVRESANEVLCSHGHRDHGYTKAVTLIPGAGSPFQVTRLETYHDNQQGALRGMNTIHILDNGMLRIAHLGDLGCELTREQKEALMGLDAVMIPIGGFYTIDAGQAAALIEAITPRVVIPMHYRSGSFGFDVLGTLEEFTDRFEIVVEYPGDTLELTKDTDPHTAVLRLDQGRQEQKQ